MSRALRDGQEEIKAQLNALSVDVHVLTSKVASPEMKNWIDRIKRQNRNMESLAIRFIKTMN
ncbi:hypothetical protein [Thermicanus aegyptius]|uniref:hypothetical protein n=1 Tax=Thermicanus aegyptius TaxID=94009 RepID=UPI00048C9B68|nr:hypothetical protein [Thermicanus aegyptius]